MSARVMAAALACVALLGVQTVAGGWAINSHIYSANLIREDVIDDDRIDINEVVRADDGTMTTNRLGSVAVPGHIASAIRDRPLEFRAGSCCADGYPDMYIGQSIIHPYEPGQPWRASDWAMHVLACAQDYGDDDDARQKAIAFAAGWMVHYAGDAFGHTWVNNYSGGAWDWGNMGIVSKHVAIEAYMNSKLPGAQDDTLELSLDMDPAFIRDTLMLHDDIQSSIVHAGYLKALVDYYESFHAAEKKCERKMDDWWNPVSWGIGPVEEWLEHQRKECDRALYEWGECSTRNMRYLSEGKPQHIPGVVTDWAALWIPKLYLGIPQCIYDVIGWLGQPIDWIMDPVKDGLTWLMEWAYEELIEDTFKDIVNPEEFMLATHGEEVRVVVDEEFGITADHPDLDWEYFAPMYDTVVMGKLALLDGAGLAQVGSLLGTQIPTYDAPDNILGDCLNSLDASNQLALYPTCRILQTEELEQNVYRRLFKTEPYCAPPSAIDPAHLFVYPAQDGSRNLTFGLPMPDPCTDASRVIGYIYEENQAGGPDQRVPIFEAGIPTSMSPGTMTSVIRGHFAPSDTRVHRYHVAVAQTVEGSTDMQQDRGVDIKFAVQEYEQPEFDLPEMPIDPEQMVAILETMKAGMEQAQGNPDLDPQMRQQMQEGIQQANEGLEQLKKFQAQGGFEGAMAQAQQPSVPDPFVFPSAMLDQVFATAGEPLPTFDDDMPLPPAMQDMMQNYRRAVGIVNGPDAAPVNRATVTMVSRSLCNTLRGGSRTPQVSFDEWMMDKYYIGRTNEKGQYCFPIVKPGNYVMVASAPQMPKVEANVNVVFGEGATVVLPTVALVADEDATDDTGYNDGQHHGEPDFTLEVSPRIVNHEALQEDGTARAVITLWPVANFQGAVHLSARNLPKGIVAEFPDSPVTLADGPAEVRAIFRAVGKVGKATTAAIVATSGFKSHTTAVVVGLGAGALDAGPEQITVKRGGRTTIRLTWRGVGEGAQAGRIALGDLPDQVWVKATRIKAHKHVEPVDLRELTVQRAVAAHGALRRLVPRPPGPAIQRTPLVAEQIRKGPAEAPFKGILLAPDGWVELTVVIGTGVPEGALEIPVSCKLGNQTTRETIKLTIVE